MENLRSHSEDNMQYFRTIPVGVTYIILHAHRYHIHICTCRYQVIYMCTYMYTEAQMINESTCTTLA